MLQDNRRTFHPCQEFDTEDCFDDEAMQLVLEELCKLINKNPRGTATLEEWMNIIESSEESSQMLMMTKELKDAIEPFRTKDKDLELTPTDFLNLLKLIETRNTDTYSADGHMDNATPPAQFPLPESSTSATMLASRQRSSDLLSHYVTRPRLTTSRRSEQIDDRDENSNISANLDDYSASEGHPSYENSIQDPELDQASPSYVNRASTYRPLGMVTESIHRGNASYLSSHAYQRHEDDIYDDEQLATYQQQQRVAESRAEEQHRQVQELRRQLHESHSRYDDITKDYNDRVVRLEQRLEAMKQEIISQKHAMSQQQNTEQYLQKQIATLEHQMKQIESEKSKLTRACDDLKYDSTVKDDDMFKLREALSEKQEQLRRVETELIHTQEEMKRRTLEHKELLYLHRQLEEELEGSHNLQKEYDELQNENENLKNIVDRLKFDLDEARTHSTAEGKKAVIKTLQAELSTEDNYMEGEDEYDEVGERLFLESKIQEALLATRQLKETEQERDDYKLKAVSALKELDEVRKHYLKSKDELKRDNRMLQQTIERLKAQAEKERFDRTTQTSASTSASTSTERGTQHEGTQEPCPDCKTQSEKHKDQIQQLHKQVDKQSSMIQKMVQNVQNLETGTSTEKENIPSQDVPVFQTYQLDFGHGRFKWYMMAYIIGFATSAWLIDKSLRHSLWEYPVGIPVSRNPPSLWDSQVLDIFVYWLEGLVLDNEDFIHPT